MVEGLSPNRITFVEGGEHEVGLPAASLDAAYMFSVYHCVVSDGEQHMDQNVIGWLRDIGKALRPGGRLVIIENLVENKLNEEAMVVNAGAAGFRFLRKESPEGPTGTFAFVFHLID